MAEVKNDMVEVADVPSIRPMPIVPTPGDAAVDADEMAAWLPTAAAVLLPNSPKVVSARCASLYLVPSPSCLLCATGVKAEAGAAVMCGCDDAECAEVAVLKGGDEA